MLSANSVLVWSGMYELNFIAPPTVAELPINDESSVCSVQDEAVFGEHWKLMAPPSYAEFLFSAEFRKRS